MVVLKGFTTLAGLIHCTCTLNIFFGYRVNCLVNTESCQGDDSKRVFEYHLSFSSKRRHVTEKHFVIGSKHLDMLGNQTFDVLRPLSKLLNQSLKVFRFVDMFPINNCPRISEMR